jgi:hypothetical protein
MEVIVAEEAIEVASSSRTCSFENMHGRLVTILLAAAGPQFRKFLSFMESFEMFGAKAVFSSFQRRRASPSFFLLSNPPILPTPAFAHAGFAFFRLVGLDLFLLQNRLGL